MPNKKLADYVKSQIQKGFSVAAISSHLLKYGYSQKDIEDAIKSAYNPTIRHEIHLSSTTVIVVLFIFASLLGAAWFFYYSPYSHNNALKSTAKLLDLNLEPVTTTAAPGENIVFIKELSNLGSSKNYDVTIKQEVIELATNKVITSKTETRAIETFGTTQTKILIPENTKAGDYVLRAIVEYDDKKAVATLPVKIAPSAKKQTCFDGIKNQNEEGIDCGGPCKPCTEQAKDCDDNNPCTIDLMENDVCANKPIAPCCGNNICEEQEKDSCSSDCKKPKQNPEVISTQRLEEIKELAKTDPASALEQCNKVEVPDLKDTCISNIGEVSHDKTYCAKVSNARIKDLCYSNIAKITNENSICETISTDSRKDSCYMTFVLDNKDYSVCAKISNKYLRQSCESLKQLNELNKQQQNKG